MSSFASHDTKLDALVRTPLATSLVLCGVPPNLTREDGVPVPAPAPAPAPAQVLSASWVQFINECKQCSKMTLHQLQLVIEARPETEDTIEKLVFLFAVAKQKHLVRFRVCAVLWL